MNGRSFASEKETMRTSTVRKCRFQRNRIYVLVAVHPAVMPRQVPFIVFCILLWFAFANDVESLSTLRDQCLEFDIADLEGYVSTLNFANVPTVDTMFAGFECPITALPFGFLRSDWARLLLLRKMLVEESIFIEKFERLIRILIVAYQRIELGLVPNKYLNETNDGHSVTTTEFVVNTTTEITGTVGIVNHEDVTKVERNEDRNMRKNDPERTTIQFNATDVMVTDILDNADVLLSTASVNKLSEHTNTTSNVTKNSTYENQNEKIVKETKNEKDPVTSLENSTSINFEVTSMVNSSSTVKLNHFGFTTEKFNSIDSLSTVRTETLKETASQKEETERTTVHTINFHDSDDGGNRNIEDDRTLAFTTLPAGSSVNTEASANGRTDFNSFDTDREKIENDEELKVLPSTSVDTVTILPEKSEKFHVTLLNNISTEASGTSSTINSYSFNKKVTIKEGSNSSQSTESYANTILSTSSANILSTNQDFTSSESVNTYRNIKATVDRSFAASTKASTNSDPTRSTVSDVTNRQDLKETTSNEVSISEKDNPGNTSSVARNSMDYLDPSLNSIYDVFAPDSDIDGSNRMITNKLKKFPVVREQPPRTAMNFYEETVRRLSTFPWKSTTLSRNSIEVANEIKETSLGSRKRGDINTNIEKNFRFFYNLGGRSIARKKAADHSDFIRIRCKEEST